MWLRYCRFLVTSCQVTARVDTKWFQQFQRVSLTPWNSSLGLPCRKKRRRVVEKTKAKRKKLSSRREYSELLTKCSPMTLDKRDRGALRAFVCVRSVGPGEIRPSAASFTATINHNLAGHSVALARAFVGHRAGVTWNRLRTSLSSSSPPRRISRSIPQDTNHEWRRCVAYGSLTMTRCGTPLAKRQKTEQEEEQRSCFLLLMCPYCLYSGKTPQLGDTRTNLWISQHRHQDPIRKSLENRRLVLSRSKDFVIDRSTPRSENAVSVIIIVIDALSLNSQCSFTLYSQDTYCALK